MARPPWIIDSTLRDGQQSAGVAFSRRDSVRLAEAISAAGVHELEIGVPAMGDDEIETIRAIASAGMSSRLGVWCRANEYDLAQARRCGVATVHFSLPVSSIQLEALSKGMSWVLERISTLAELAHADFDRVSIGAQDASRAKPHLLAQFARAAQAAGVDRLRLADTVGVLDPTATATMIRRCRHAAPDLPIGFHAHNDLGMATANTLAAVQAGAHSVDTTIGGLGERAGNAAFEQVVMALRQVHLCPRSINAGMLLGLARTAARMANRPIPPDRPVVGECAFKHESGIHVDGLMRDARTYEPFAPETVGHAGREIVAGRHSGKAAIRQLLSNQGIETGPGEAGRLVEVVRRRSRQLQRGLTGEELCSAYVETMELPSEKAG